jgi:hypothetical protein
MMSTIINIIKDSDSSKRKIIKTYQIVQDHQKQIRKEREREIRRKRIRKT